MIIKDQSNYVCVIPSKLYFGDIKLAENEEELIKLGIKSIVSLLSNSKDIPYNPKKFLSLHIPTEDLITSSLTEWAEKTSSFIDENIKNDKPVYIHCSQGISRSSSCVLHYLITKQNMNLKNAFYFLRQKRKVICPSIGFFENLADLDKKIFGVNSFSLEEYSIMVINENFPDISKNKIKEVYDKYKKLYKEGEKKEEYLKIKIKENIEPIGFYTLDELLNTLGKDKFYKRKGCSIHHPFD